MIFKILTVGLSITAQDGICLYTFVLCDYNQVLCPNLHTAKTNALIKTILWHCALVVSFSKTKGTVSFFYR